MGESIQTQILRLAQLAEAPPRHFRPWHAPVVYEAVSLSSGVNPPALSYKVPLGQSLIVTHVEGRIAPRNTTPPVVFQQVEELSVYPSLFGYWALDRRPVTATDVHYTALLGDQLLVFPGRQCARLHLYADSPTPPTLLPFAFWFRISGFLTAAEYGQRLLKQKSEFPNRVQLNCP